MNNPQIHQHSNPSKFNTDKSLLPSGSPSHGGRESGQALFILLALIIAIAIGFVFGFLRPTALAMANDNKSGQALAQAKDALIGWAVSQPGVSITDMPGLLPYPDRNADGNYDGHSDCPPLTISNNLLLGKLPFLGDQVPPCQSTQRDTMALDKVDGAGERLWYAVSGNLLRAPSVTPNIPANLSTTSGWLTVYDATGAALSALVAFIVIAPGNALPGQDRSGAAPNPDNYLDSYTVGGTTYSNYDTTTLNFIMAQDTARVPAGSNQFNDRLL